MLRQNNIRTACVAIWVVFLATAAGGQEVKAPELAEADAEAAYQWVQGWVRSEDGVPAAKDLPSRPVTGLFGVYVTLRQEGRVLGQGQALRQDVKDAIDQAGPPVEPAILLAAATRQALAQLDDKLTKDAVKLGINNREQLDAAILKVRQRVQVDIQLGHTLESIVIPEDAGLRAVFNAFAPGYHGLRLDGPNKPNADYVWPATELASNASPPRLLFKLLQQQGYDPQDLPTIARADGPALQRFDIMHLAQPGPAQPMRRLIRGNLILQQQNIDARTIAGLGERAAQYLDRLIVTDANTKQVFIRGTYAPSLQRYTAKWAKPREAALLCYALNRHARVALDAGQGGESTRARSRRVLRLIQQLAPSTIENDKPIKHLTAAFLLLAFCESPVDPSPEQYALRDRLGKTLLGLAHPKGGGYLVAPDSEKTLSRATASVITYALASWYEQTRNPAYVKPIWRVLGELIEVNDKDPRVIDLLWVNHALSKAGPILAAAHPEPDKAKAALKAWHAKLADYLKLLSEQQLKGKPVLGPNDVLGGFILEKADPGSPPNPSWQSAMPLAFTALALREPAVVPADKTTPPILTAALGARFLGQLMITEPSTYYIRDAQPALGGVRARLYDNTLYPDCSSIALIALTELQHSLATLAKRTDDKP